MMFSPETSLILPAPVHRHSLIPRMFSWYPSIFLAICADAFLCTYGSYIPVSDGKYLFGCHGGSSRILVMMFIVSVIVLFFPGGGSWPPVQPHPLALRTKGFSVRVSIS